MLTFVTTLLYLDFKYYMSLPDIGARCSLPSCSVHDFLPIRCKCDNLFCRDHINPDLHACTANQPVAAPDGASSTLKRQRCAAEGCPKLSLESAISADNATDPPTGRTPAICPECSRSFCAYHRTPTSHSCPTRSTESGKKNAAAHELLAKHFSSSKSSPVRAPQGPSSKKAAGSKQVELMRMRHHAEPGDPKDAKSQVPLSERIHVKVGVERDGAITWNMFWFRKTIGAGKALDLLATRLRLTGPSLELVKVDPEAADGIAIRPSTLLSSQLADGDRLILRV